MGEGVVVEAIHKEIAACLCEEIYRANRHRWYSLYAWWCWGCRTFTQGDPERRCFAATPDNRGCTQVNGRHAQMRRS